MAVRVTTRIQVLQKNLDKLLDRIVETDLLRRAENVLSEIQILAPRSGTGNSFTDGVPDRHAGGRLANSFAIGYTTQRGKRVIRIFSNAKNTRGRFYAGMVDRGTSPHVIQGNPLSFKWISKNVFVITPSVNHPGTKATGFLRAALVRGFHR